VVVECRVVEHLAVERRPTVRRIGGTRYRMLRSFAAANLLLMLRCRRSLARNGRYLGKRTLMSFLFLSSAAAAEPEKKAISS
jgi:hypothetical protein